MWLSYYFFAPFWLGLYLMGSLSLALIQYWMERNNRTEESIIKTSWQRHLITMDLISLIHCLGSFGLASWAIWQNWAFQTENHPVDLFLLQFGTGYFLLDTVEILATRPTSVMLIHHLVCLLGWGMVYHLGQLSWVMTRAYWIGEITNPCQIIWRFARRNKLQTLYQTISPIYTYYFTFVRCLIVPVITWYLNCYIWQSSVATSWKILLTSSSLTLTIAGFVWSYWLVQGYRRFQQKNN